MTTHLYTICWNEADILPFFFRHYDPWVDRYVIFDDGSDDGSLELLHAHPKVEVRRFSRLGGSFVYSHQAMQNQCWKESRKQADWVVITAIDEHLTVPGKPMADYLSRQRRAGVTYLPALGFEMISDVLPAPNTVLAEAIGVGVPNAAFNKLSIFNPDGIEETGFTVGRHGARPEGRLVRPPKTELLLLHFKHLDPARTYARQQALGARLGPLDRQKNFGSHYGTERAAFDQQWAQQKERAINLRARGFDALQAAARPFWWN